MSDATTDLTPQQKRVLLAKLLKAKASQEPECHPLSYGQRALWFIHHLDPSSPAYNIMCAAYVRSELNVNALARSFQAIIKRHAALRTTFETRSGEPVQRVHDDQPFDLDVVDTTHLDEAALEREMSKYADDPFDLQVGPVLRVHLFQRRGPKHVLLIVAHHIAMDFWSFDLLFEELEALYRQETTGIPSRLSRLPIEFSDFAHWQRQMLDGPEGERLWKYWQRELAGDLPTLELPTDRARPPVESFRGDSYRFRLPAELSKDLMQLARAEGVTPYVVLLSAFEVLLFRYCRQEEVLVGTPAVGRSRSEFENLVGYFLNPVVIRLKLEAGATFVGLLAQVREKVVHGITHQDYPFPLLVEKLRLPRDPSRSPLFQAAFSWDKPRKWVSDRHVVAQRDGGASRDSGSLGLEPFVLGQRGSAFDLTLMMLQLGDSFTGVLQYNSDLFDESTIARMSEHLRLILESVAVDAHQRCVELPLLTQKEQLLLNSWNETRGVYPKDLCVHELFDQQASRTPDAVAVVHGDQEVSYGELDRRSKTLASYLQTCGVGPEVLVAIHLERSVEMIVSMLAVLRAGGAYVPLDPDAPQGRLAYMVEESRARVLLTQGRLVETLPDTSARVVCIDDASSCSLHESNGNVVDRAKPDHLAYVIFTSGSTGKPKGVQIEHRAVVNFLTSMQREPGVTNHDILLAVTALSFDISVLELLLPLTVGARIVLVDRAVTSNGVELAAALRESGATIMQATPATWRLLVRAGWEGDGHMKILCGGEEMPRDLADDLLRRGGSLWNMYGPTETTIWSAVDCVKQGHGPVPIGRPIANTKIYVLDSNLNRSPLGVPGDLYISGAGLARGYLNRPELTAEKFIAGSGPTTGHERLYKTGDVARFRPDGQIEFLGRADFQVKVQGHRIELGEIEATMTQLPSIREAVVVARQIGQSSVEKILVAYFVPAGKVAPSHSELRSFLKQKLPDYMVPSSFTPLESFPLSEAGKVDRKSLPAPGSARPVLDAEYVPPQSEAEHALAQLWSDVLDVDKIGVHDNFFELGGASMQSLEIASRASDFGFEVTPVMVFQYPTIAELAGACSQASDILSQGTTDVAPDVAACASATSVESALADARAADETNAADRSTRKLNVLIDSIGVYLPPRTVTTQEVLNRCRQKVWFPLGRMTGIESRRMAGETEFSTDLAVKAAEECLASSQCNVDDVDLVICCNIIRGDAPDELSLDPNTSLQLKKRLDLPNAVVFDISNACAGMFTAISIVEAFLQTGAIRLGLVVSGEYISAITRTAQLEISGFLDPRLACLTVGDAGAALLLKAAPNGDVGFHELELYTLGEYSRMCIGTISKEPHGGPILLVPDPIRHTSVAIEHSVKHAQHVFERSPWRPEEMQHLIMHQTSDRSLRDGMRAINKAFKKKVCDRRNTINNLANRGNTASTSHVVALWDHILNGRINSGDKVVFGITGSGQTIGTGIYTLDDLPDRLRRYKANGSTARRPPAPRQPSPRRATSHGRVRICSVATLSLDDSTGRETPLVTAAAAEACLEQSPYDCGDIDLLLFAGMTRSDYISEPAIATLIAGELEMNHLADASDAQKTLALDVYNGAVGFLNACHVATQMIAAEKCKTAMVVASELEVNRDNFPEEPVDLAEVASAVILDSSAEEGKGFGRFVFKYCTDRAAARKMVGRYRDGRPYCQLEEEPEIARYYLELVPAAVEELLAAEGLSMSEVRVVLPSQFSSRFNQELASLLGLESEQVVDLKYGADLFTSALPFSFQHALQQRIVRSGDIGLIINVGSGLQLGCASYYF